MAYPTYGISIGSEEIINSDSIVDRSQSGKVRMRALADSNFRTFKVVHDVLTDTQKAALITDYNTNKALTFTFLWKPTNTNYTVMYNGPPVFKALGGTFWSAEVTLEQVS